jgi:hypothetical protein
MSWLNRWLTLWGNWTRNGSRSGSACDWTPNMRQSQWKKVSWKACLINSLRKHVHFLLKALLILLKDRQLMILDKMFNKRLHDRTLVRLLSVIKGLMRFLPSNRVTASKALELLRRNTRSIKPLRNRLRKLRSTKSLPRRLQESRSTKPSRKWLRK